MNPFDLRGPEFLVFYFILSTIVIGVLILLRRAAEFGEIPKTDVSDPYLIAYLRGGKAETLRIATLSLIERGLLSVNDQTLQTTERTSSHSVTNPVEEKLLKIFIRSGKASSMFNSPTMASACSDYEKRLTQDGLLPNEETKAKRRQRLFYALVILLSVGFIKIVVALSRGHTNLGFLITLMIAASLIAIASAFPRLTQKGIVFLEDIQSLNEHLKINRTTSKDARTAANSMMAAALFGIGALAAFPDYSFAQTLFPSAYKQPNSGGFFNVSSCGSSCGGGGGCGGGGCGGGCGGCGA